jgi:hypothetical protein
MSSKSTSALDFLRLRVNWPFLDGLALKTGHIRKIIIELFIRNKSKYALILQNLYFKGIVYQ